jgi:hypothetical protein
MGLLLDTAFGTAGREAVWNYVVICGSQRVSRCVSAFENTENSDRSAQFGVSTRRVRAVVRTHGPGVHCEAHEEVCPGSPQDVHGEVSVTGSLYTPVYKHLLSCSLTINHSFQLLQPASPMCFTN